MVGRDPLPGASLPLPVCFLPRAHVSEGGSLAIHNVTRSDAGPYTCTATNQFGVAQDTGGLVVKGTLSPAFVLGERGS